MLVWVLAGGLWLVPDGWIEGGSPALETRAGEIETALDRLHGEAMAVAAEALGAFPPQLAPASARDVLLERLEGVAIVDPDGGYLIWEGSPPDTPGGFLDPDGPVSWIRRHGAVSRWIVRAGPDEEGWLSLASFTLRTHDDDRGLVAFLPPELMEGVEVRLVPGEKSPSEEGTLVRSWSAAQRSAPVEIRLRPAAAGPRAQRLRGQAVAIAVVATLILLAFVPLWRSRLTSNAGFVQALVAIVGSRLLLGWSGTPQWLLAREAASASLFGVRTFGRLLASPADLLLSGVAVYLIALALRARLGSASARVTPGARWSLIGATLATAVLTGRLIVVVSRNSRDVLLDTGGEWASDARLLVAAGLVLALLAVATLASSSLLRSALHEPATLEALVPTVLCFSVLAIATAFVMQHRQEERTTGTPARRSSRRRSWSRSARRDLASDRRRSPRFNARSPSPRPRPSSLDPGRPGLSTTGSIALWRTAATSLRSISMTSTSIFKATSATTSPNSTKPSARYDRTPRTFNRGLGRAVPTGPLGASATTARRSAALTASRRATPRTCSWRTCWTNRTTSRSSRPDARTSPRWGNSARPRPPTCTTSCTTPRARRCGRR